jgi:predicted DNA-binding transcriptional regulator AlpA
MKPKAATMDKDSPRRILNSRQVTELLGLNAVTLWRMCRDGRFPAPLKLSIRKNGWPADEIYAWIASRPKANYGGDRTAA